MRAADVLATAASTFSFTAAMLAHDCVCEGSVTPPPSAGAAGGGAPPCGSEPPGGGAPPGGGTPPGGGVPGGGTMPARFWRADPAAGALVEFEPWDAPVLLNACSSGTHFRRDGGDAAGGGGGGGDTGTAVLGSAVGCSRKREDGV